MRHVPELDGLRGIGAVFVVAFHWAPTYIFWSWTFVNMFFVLSGYLVGRIIIEAVQERAFSLPHFYLRRILRIWPVYYVALAAILAYYLLLHGNGFFHAPYFDDWLRSLAYLQFTPFYLHPGIDPNQIFTFLPGMLPIWSLAVEEQFYLVLPLVLMLLVPRIGARRLVWCCACVAVLGPLARFFGFVPTLLLTQLDGLMLGVILAALFSMELDTAPASRRWLTVLFGGAFVLACAALAPYVVQGYQQTPGPHALFSDPLIWSYADLFFFGLIGLIVLYPGNRVTALLGCRLGVYLGAISYAVYVFHFPLLTLVKPHVMARCPDGYGWVGGLIMIALLFGLPHLSRHLLEKPFLRLKRYFPNRKTGHTQRELGRQP